MLASSFDTQIDALWRAWLDLQAKTSEALYKGAANYFTCIRQSACDALALEALSCSRLGQSDERVYNHLVRLMETYREVIGLFDSPIKDTSPDLVAGLCDILCSRLRQFEDDATSQGNPVAKEKYTILEQAITSIAWHIESLENSYLAGIDIQSCSNLTQHTLQESIIQAIQPSLQAYYTQTLQACLSSIDDLHTRKTAAYYTDLLEREWEVLGLIIQVQVKAIENAFEASNDNAAHDLYPILSKLREAYQQTGPVVSGLRKMMQSTNASRLEPGPGVQQDFTHVLTAGILAPILINIDYQNFVAALLPKADELFESLRASHLESINNLQQEVKNEISLAEKIVSSFVEAGTGLVSLHDTQQEPSPASSDATELESEPELAPEIEPEPELIVQESIAIPSHNIDNEILTGITETLEIKVESLAESLQQFTENSTQLLASIPSGLPRLTEEDLLTAAAQMQEAWCANPPTLETIADFIAACASLEAFAAYDGQFAKHIASTSAKIEKASFRFKKETLLYEISTYEEILYHSVSRLRESPLPHVAAAVSLLDETFAKLEPLLAEKGITVIRPAAHEPFNGREHEVLLAEETDGFAKGEIIKVMTSGYKYKDQVILRANVIAAR
ncbi:MAG: nucleotide exchange factor GrpE [Defluviitaleaceae bacterium]|nr:nucleotide exchange factor GrpE [Defluviitaleaceae bacterium]